MSASSKRRGWCVLLKFLLALKGGSQGGSGGFRIEQAAHRVNQNGDVVGFGDQFGDSAQSCFLRQENLSSKALYMMSGTEGMRLFQNSCCFQTVHHGHGEVQHNQVRTQESRLDPMASQSILSYAANFKVSPPGWNISKSA